MRDTLVFLVLTVIVQQTYAAPQPSPQETLRNLTTVLQQAEQNIFELVQEMEELEIDTSKIPNNFMEQYTQKKTELHKVRQNLRLLAKRTLRETTLYTAALQIEDEILQQATSENMEELIAETKKQLTTANQSYNSAVDILTSLSLNLEQVVEKLERSLTNGTQEYEEWTSNLRTGVYGGVGAASVGFLIADIFGCLGLCSLIGTTTSVATSVAAVESSIAEYSTELERIKIKFENVHDSLLGLDDIVRSSLQKEIDLLAKWENDAETVSYNLANYSKESLTSLEPVRKIILRGIGALQSQAKEFLARPVFSEEEKLRRYRNGLGQ